MAVASTCLLREDELLEAARSGDEEAATEDSPAARIVTSDVFEWVPGKFFVLDIAYGRIGVVDAGGTEIIGYDEANDSYTNHFFDSAGNVTTETLTESDGVWTWQGAATRATSVISETARRRPATTSDQTTASTGCLRCG